MCPQYVHHPGHIANPPKYYRQQHQRPPPVQPERNVMEEHPGVDSDSDEEKGG